MAHVATVLSGPGAQLKSSPRLTTSRRHMDSGTCWVAVKVFIPSYHEKAMIYWQL